MANQNNRIFGLDIIRVVSILYIIIHHTRDYAYTYQINILDEILTGIALSLFVFISGYFITVSLYSFHTREDVFAWLRKRFIRLYPLYLASTFLYVVYYFHDLNIRMTIAQILSVNMLISPWFGESFRTIWFVSMLVLYYLFFAVSFYKGKEWFPYIKLGAIFVLLIILRLLFGLVEDRLLLYLPIFALGLWAGENGLLTKPVSWRIFFLSLVPCVVGAVLYSRLRDNTLLRNVTQGAIGILAVIPVWVGAKYLASRISNFAFVLFLSYSSYCMYLFHRFVFRALLILYYPKTTAEMYAFLLLLGVPLVTGFGYLVQRGYDYMVNRFTNVQISAV